MKARLVPLYFEPGRDRDFDTQLQVLAGLLRDDAELLPPVPAFRPFDIWTPWPVRQTQPPPGGAGAVAEVFPPASNGPPVERPTGSLST